LCLFQPVPQADRPDFRKIPCLLLPLGNLCANGLNLQLGDVAAITAATSLRVDPNRSKFSLFSRENGRVFSRRIGGILRRWLCAKTPSCAKSLRAAEGCTKSRLELSGRPV
jgi:hypothetical protein